MRAIVIVDEGGLSIFVLLGNDVTWVLSDYRVRTHFVLVLDCKNHRLNHLIVLKVIDVEVLIGKYIPWE